ncbi:MAG TPA: DUF2065 domain-containing protein [Thermodesulfobacteriota bacterium]|nr:DUF2065 domain-containing protein [Thermodesulfobacteriota bacterium]
MTQLLTILGVILVLEGIPYLAFPRKTKHWALAVQEVPDRSLRLIGFIAMAAGLVILYSKRFL